MNFSSAKSWLIVGGGISGKGAARFLASRGKRAFLYDDRPLSEEDSRELIKLGVGLFAADSQAAALKTAEAAVLSPGVPLHHPMVLALKDAGIPITSEIELGLSEFGGKVVAVTGTNGKSTTTMMLAHLLRKNGIDALAAGNIGEPPTLAMAKGMNPEVFVLELSSYQLEHISHLATVASIFHNFSFDHQERHKTMRDYFAAKWRLVNEFSANGLGFVTAGVFAQAKEYGCSLPGSSRLRVVETPHDARIQEQRRYGSLDREGVFICAQERTALSGMSFHNILNGVFAALAAQVLTKRSVGDLFGQLGDFPFLPYRYEEVGRWGETVFINDSKATNVDATLAALNNVRQGTVLLLLGGQGKGESFLPLLAAKDMIGKVLCFGKSGPDINRELSPHLPCVLLPSMHEIFPIIEAHVRARPMTVLFSPGCASFDEFKNFEHRGDVFNSGIAELLRRLQ